MLRSLWIAKTGLDAQQTQLDVISNNLANVSTNGYKRARAVFEDLIYQTLRQPGAQSSQQTTIPSGLQLGTGVRPVATARMFTQGNLQQTGNNLDVAINGQGFFQVQMPDGTTAYTRDGSFHVDAQGQIVTSNGNPVLPAIHGGMTGAFLETTAIVGVTRELGVNAAPKPIGLTINYLRSGRALDSFAKVSIVKKGRRVVAFEAQAWQDDPTKPIASAFGHFMLRTPPSADEEMV